MQVMEMVHWPPAVAAELRWTLGVQSEAPAASVPGYIETEGAPNQWFFETSFSM